MGSAFDRREVVFQRPNLRYICDCHFILISRLEKEWDKELNEESSTTTSKPLDRVDEKGERMSLSESEAHGLSKLTFTDLAKRVKNMPEHTRRQIATKEKEKGNEVSMLV